jgi:galactonate dehydratase
VSLTPDSDRPYVFVKLETDAGVVGWGEGHARGQSRAVIACVDDFKEFILGSDRCRWSIIGSRCMSTPSIVLGPVIGSAISGIDQALWDIRGKVLGLLSTNCWAVRWIRKGVRGYYHSRASNRGKELAQLR